MARPVARAAGAAAAETAQIRALLVVLGKRVIEAARAVDAARTVVAAAEREHAACAACVEIESARLAAIITHLGSPEVSASAPLYTDTLALRELAARDLARERFVFERAVGERRDALAARGVAERALARLRARESALGERLETLAATGARGRELAEESEVDELVAVRHVQLTGSAHG